MAISRKPLNLVPATSSVSVPDEQTVRNLINKGGSVAALERGTSAAKEKLMLVQLRLYPDLVQEIDAVRSQTPLKRRRGIVAA